MSIIAAKYEDLTGQKFGRLTVLECIGSVRGNKLWRCSCECGNETTATSYVLKAGVKSSCGCLRRENTANFNRQTKKMYNTYTFKDNYVIGYTNKGEEFYVDFEDYELIKGYCWYIDTRDGYVRSHDTQHNSLLLHRLIMDNHYGPIPDKIVIDHIGGSATKNDNRKFNLRLATNAENCRNCNSYDGPSGVRGVFYNSSTNKWQSYINVDPNAIWLGQYDTFEEAVNVRKEAEVKYYKEFAYDASQQIYLEGLSKCQNTESNPA